MNRKHVPWVICLLMLLVPAGLCPASASPVSSALATASALAPTLLAGIAHTATAAAATANSAVAQTPTTAPAAKATATVPPPTATVAASNTPAATKPPAASPTLAASATPTTAPALAPITDSCALVDLKFLNDTTGYKVTLTKKVAQPNSFVQCYALSADASAGGTLSVAQGDVALTLQLGDLAAIKQRATGCNWAQLSPGTPAEIKTERAALDKLGLPADQLLAKSIELTLKATTDKGCAGPNGALAIPGLGEIATADHNFGYEELAVAYRGALIYVVVYKTGVAPADNLPAMQKWMTSIVAQLAAKP